MATIDRGPPGEAAAAPSGPPPQHNRAPAQHDRAPAHERTQHNPAPGQHDPAPLGYLPRSKPPRLIGAFRHWLFAVNLAGGLFLAGALLAPVSAALGWPLVAGALYAAYHFTCHQWAFRSFFLFGQQPVYTPHQLVELGLDPFTFVGSPTLGWKLAFCERDLAIYLGLLIVGLLYARRRHLQPAGFLPYTVLILPMALDGFTQLFGWRESTWELRVSTGLLFGLASAWLVLPRLDASFGLQPRAAGYAPASACEPLSPQPPRG